MRSPAFWLHDSTPVEESSPSLLLPHVPGYGAKKALTLGVEEELQLLKPLLARGDGASEQRAAAETAGGSLLGAARWLAEQTVEGV